MTRTHGRQPDRVRSRVSNNRSSPTTPEPRRVPAVLGIADPRILSDPSRSARLARLARSGGDETGDPPARHPRVPGAGRRTAVPAGRLRDRRPPRHRGAGRARRRLVVLLTAAGVFVFLAYGTTSVVARRLGAGDGGALAAGMDGMWLAVALGALAAVVLRSPRPACRGLGGSPACRSGDDLPAHLRLGIPSMLVVLGATGVLRGLQDTRTPLVVAVAGFGANIVLNLVLVYGAGLGIAGSALGTVLAQTGMAVALVVTVLRRRSGSARRCAAHGGGPARGPRRRAPARADPRAARRHRRDDGGRRALRRHRARRPPDRDHRVERIGVRPRRAGHRRPGDHRQGARRRGRGPARAAATMARWGVGPGW